MASERLLIKESWISSNACPIKKKILPQKGEIVPRRDIAIRNFGKASHGLARRQLTAPSVESSSLLNMFWTPTRVLFLFQNNVTQNHNRDFPIKNIFCVKLKSFPPLSWTKTLQIFLPTRSWQTRQQTFPICANFASFKSCWHPSKEDFNTGRVFIKANVRYIEGHYRGIL